MKQNTKKTPAKMQLMEKKQRNQEREMRKLQRREDYLRWVVLTLVILLLILTSFFGWATDWTRGLRKVDVTKPGTTTAADTSSAAGTPTTSTGTSDTSSTNGTSRDTNTGTTTNSTTRDSSTTVYTNNTTGTTTPTNTGLLSLYTDSSAGDDISKTLDQASSLAGITQTCSTQLLIQVCNFTDGVATVTTRNLIGTGIITGITKNF